MIRMQSILYVHDNSGAKKVMCLKVLLKGTGRAGDLLIVSIKKALPRRRLHCGEKYKAIMLMGKQTLFRDSAHYFKMTKNFVVLLKKRDPIPLANRIKVPAVMELNKIRMQRTLFLTSTII